MLGRRKHPEPPPRPVEEMVAGVLRPAVHLRTTSEERGSRFGGLPQLPERLTWPAKDGAPLGFLACVDLAELAAVERFDWLPAKGRLLFFYDAEQQVWGFDPADEGSWRVLFVEPGEDVAEVPAPSGLAPEHVLSRRCMKFRRVELPPSAMREGAGALDLTDAEADALEDYRRALLGGEEVPSHQIGGYPDPMQGDSMELDCQLVSNGLYCGDESGYQDPRAEALAAGAADWRLLLQMDTDDDLEVMWGDAGLIYFWIREQDARRRAFDKAWFALQCG